MPIEILMPALSPTMTEGNLAKWTKKEGDSVAPGDVIAEIETDKATMEVEAVDEGTLGKIVVSEGSENVAVNKVIALLLEEGEDKAALDSWKPKEEPKEEKAEAEAASDSGEKKEAKPASGGGAVVMAAEPSKSPDLPEGAIAPSSEVKASPLAKRLAEEQGVALEKVKGTGPHGRIVKEDVENFLQYGGVSGHVVRDGVSFSKTANNGMRKTIAKRLLEAKQTIPHFYLNVECEIDKLLDVRAQLNSAAPKDKESGKPLYKISVNDLVIKASALALRDKPEANASWYDDAVVQYSNVDISVAVATEGGLITPILKNADQKALAQLSSEMKSLAKRARDGKLQPEEYKGGGFSISNLGMYGVKSFSAIINPPQSCILAVGAGEKKLVMRGGQPTEVTVMTVTLSVDHRSVDGALGAEWLQVFKNYIENPALLVG
jgi:pyruvate dehydrogenase E2 component (dihydrolipoamide acetyltransferase)